MQPMPFETWTQEDAERELPKRLKDALTYRSQFEADWRRNEVLLFMPNAMGGGSDQATLSYDSAAELWGGDLDSGDSWISVNYAFKYLRYIHSQMAANPPSVMPLPTSADYKDRRAADVADDLVNYGRRQYKIQDQVDLTTLQTLAYGTGVIKGTWDANAGEILKVSKKKRQLVMTGDIRVRPVLIWDFAYDHTARSLEDIRYVFERHVMSLEEAKYRFPKYAEELEVAGRKSSRVSRFFDGVSQDPATSRIEIWEYIEKGLPWNGMAGRRCFLMGDKVLSDITANPNPDAALGYFLLTDVDVPGQVYGRTFIDYLARIQDVLNRLDSTILDGVQAHGNVRMVVYDASENQDGLPSNSHWEVANIKGAAGQKPDFIDPPQLMGDIYKLRDALLAGMEQIAGVNDSMMGKVDREMSGFSLQTAINAGNMVRRRLFNKYEGFVEAIYRFFLRLVQENWQDERKILVTGEENALSVAYYSGADLTSGFDLDVRYGASFSLDPSSRREEIMQILPLLKEAGYDMRTILGMLKLNDVAGLFDMATVAERRQLEIFDEMIAKSEVDGLTLYIKPERGEEHDGMLKAAYEFRMSMAFKVLPPELKVLIQRHIDEREAIKVAQATPAAGAAGVPAAQPLPGLPGGLATPPAEAPLAPPVALPA